MNDSYSNYSIKNINYDRVRHIELLKKKFISQDINRDESSELLTYKVITTANLEWYIRDYYLELLKDFLEGKLQTFEFCLNIEKAGRLTADIVDTLESNFILLSLDEKALEFSDLLEKLHDVCFERLEPDQRDEDTDARVKTISEETYLKIQKFLNEE